MQAHMHSDEVGCSTCGLSQQTYVSYLFIGTAVMLGSYIAGWVYPDNKMVSEFAVVIGAFILALPIFISAIRDIIKGHMHMDELVALAVLAAMMQGDYRTAGIVAFFMLISLLIETRTAHGAQQAIESLVRMAPSTARRINTDGQDEEVPATELHVADRIRVRPGETIPVDGLILSGQSSISEATITGESLPRDKAEGEAVFAGTHNLTGAIDVEVEKIGEDTALGQVRELILAAEKTRLPIAKIVDRYAGYYTPVVLMIAALIWFFTNNWNHVIVLLVLSCPCAFILATPTAMVAALSSAARFGVLIKNVVDLESASRITAMIFDKTGTLTTGELGVVKLAPAEGVSNSELMHAAASVEKNSNHPVAKALGTLAAEAELSLAEVNHFHEEPGKGVRAEIDGETFVSGRFLWLRESGVDDVPDEEQADRSGLSVIGIAKGGRFIGWIGLQDQIRDGAEKVLRDLQALNVKRIMMVTGDREQVAAQVSANIGGCEYLAECLPEEKSQQVEAVKEEGYQVAFVGDGVNDAPALAASHSGIAMGAAGSDVAIHSANIALMNNDLSRLPFIIQLSRQARNIIYQNLAIGFFFIIAGLILMTLGLMTPILAAIFHNAGSLFVVFNSARLVRMGEEDDLKSKILPTEHMLPTAVNSGVSAS